MWSNANSISNTAVATSTIKTKKKKRNQKLRQDASEKHKTVAFAATANLEKAIRQTREKVAKIAQEHKAQNRKFRDREFDLFVNKSDCLYSVGKESYTCTDVKRVSSLYKKPQFFIDGVEPNDIKQGAVGDCWFVASLAVITNIPSLLETICVARDEEVGVYGFIFFKVIEAYAKIHGDYESISGGYTGQGIEDLTGGVYTTTFVSDILDKERFWNEELKNVNDNTLFACARYNDNNIEPKGTISGHAYSILRVAEIEDGIKLVLVRNPWGGTEWTGAWSDGSKEWTSERMKILNHRFGDDGAFWMCYEDFLEYWNEIDKCRLFDSSWTVYSTWINYNVVPKSNGKFTLTIPEKCDVVIVLQQPDDRYFSDPPKFEYQLSFRIYEKGNSTYLTRSRLTVPYGPRSVNHEVELPAGTYEIIPHIYREPIVESENPSNTSTDPSESDELKLLSKRRKEMYSKNKGLTLEGEPGEFPRKDEKNKDDADPEADTRATEGGGDVEADAKEGEEKKADVEESNEDKKEEVER
ncbi:6551_t:CDS:2 [Acaulospora colombiana]|uniref:6551_t:CDS:1 n=1 Tax=Acaulospora colombiana TaxID=27376 RepID=A0ACA9JYF4_9GLOM|nr:6551_t:CDS:2 [Acaulospora colombiana]